jgi:S1-C subfamily serine protease
MELVVFALFLVPAAMGAGRNEPVEMEVRLVSGEAVTLTVEFLYDKEGVETFLAVKTPHEGKGTLKGDQLDKTWIEVFKANSRSVAGTYWYPNKPPPSPAQRQVTKVEPARPPPNPPPKPLRVETPKIAETPKIVEEAAKSVALITVRDDRGKGFGSGFLISHNGRLYVATNVHVVICDSDLEDISIDFEGGQHCGVAGILFSDENDIALLLPDKELSLPALPLASKVPSRETPVFAIGNSEGRAVNRILPGKVIARGSQNGIEIIESDCEFVGGNSGGPLLTADGEVVGINTWAQIPTSSIQKPTVQGTSFAQKGRRISQCVSVIEGATDSAWWRLRRYAADRTARSRTLVLCEKLFVPDRAFWNYTVNQDSAKRTASKYVSKDLAEASDLLVQVVETHDLLVGTRLAFLLAYREAHNAARLGRPMDFPLKSLSFQENEFRKDWVRFEKTSGKLIEALDRTVVKHPAMDDPKIVDEQEIAMQERAKRIRSWFNSKKSPLAMEYEEISKRMAEISGLAKSQSRSTRSRSNF